MDINNKPVYPVEPWKVTEARFTMEMNYRNETTFALSNGYIGTRGTMEEGYDFDVEEGLEGNFINGFYESEQIRYGEWNYGFPTESQSLLNLPDCKAVKLFADGEEFDIRRGTVKESERSLHMDKGYVSRHVVWTSEAGKTIELNTRRLVSFADKNLMEIRYEVKAVDFDGQLELVSLLRADVENHTRKTNPLVDYGPFGRRLEPDMMEGLDGDGNGILYYEGTTKHSRLTMACGCSHRVVSGTMTDWECSVSGDMLNGQVRMSFSVKQGEPVILEKQIVYTSCLDMDRSALRPFVLGKLKEAKTAGWQREEELQRAYMESFWKNADVTVDGDDALVQGLRFNLFHIMQAAGRDGRTGMGAKGLSGEGYEGHYFWDTEMYVVPVFVYTCPNLARQLLSYRFHTIDEARRRARVLGHERGALYPWRTINGAEASTYYPLGTAQYHINADIAYACKLYVDVTGDMEFLKEQAAEILVETARVWADVGCFAESRDGKYCICAVTGPDEYNAVVDNNFYTNLMARENLRDAKWALETLERIDAAVYGNLVRKLELKETEVGEWQKIIDHMYFPYDEKRGIYPLDDGFMQRKPWDDSRIPPEKRHLLYENYHPLFIFRQRMSKQADAILGMYLHSNLFTQEELKRNYDFYQEVTLHHSSLSTCIFGILASQIGYHEEAYQYFSQSARMDLDDYHNNFYAGIHAANMAGTWQAVVNGFGGLRMNRGYLELNPMLPDAWKGYGFHIRIGGRLLKVEVDREQADVMLVEGTEVRFFLCGKEKMLRKAGEHVTEKI